MEQTELRRMARLEQSRVNASEKKRGRSERSNNITESKNSRSKIEKKSVARRSERRVRKVSRSRADQAV